MTTRLALSIAALSLSACTSIAVTPLAASYQVKSLCIRENPKVMVDDLIPVIKAGLADHHIQSELIASTVDKAAAQDNDNQADEYWMTITPTPDHCDFNLTYTARRSWDMGTYLSSADIVISDKKAAIANAHYHLRNKGGLSMFKWQGVKTKLDPVLNELLQFYP